MSVFRVQISKLELQSTGLSSEEELILQTFNEEELKTLDKTAIKV